MLFVLRFDPSGLRLSCASGQLISEAVEQSGMWIPLSCRNGVCEVCEARLKQGKVVTKDGVVTKADHESPSQGVLLCQVCPQSDCVIEIERIYGKGERGVKKLACQVIGVDELNASIYRARLRLPAGKLPEYFAGQYLSIELPGKTAPNYFSIASAPGQREIELHIQADPHLDTAVEIVEYLKKSETVSVSLAFGKACLPAVPKCPLILMAAGTGFAQMKSIIEFVFQQGSCHPVTLYWGVRRESDMYMQSLAKQWQHEHPEFRFVPLIAEDDTLAGVEHHNQLAEAVIADGHDLSQCEVFVSGSPRLVFSAMDELVAGGLAESQFYSDVLEYATKEQF